MENRHKTCFTQENSRLRSRESSTDSNNSEQNRDKKEPTQKYHLYTRVGNQRHPPVLTGGLADAQL